MGNKNIFHSTDQNEVKRITHYANLILVSSKRALNIHWFFESDQNQHKRFQYDEH